MLISSELLMCTLRGNFLGKWAPNSADFCFLHLSSRPGYHHEIGCEVLCAVERLLGRVRDEARDDLERCSKNESNGADNEQEVD